VTEQAKFELAWRAGAPILDYRLTGYWTKDDAHQWLDAMTGAVAGRPGSPGPWYMLGNLSELKTQTDEVNTIRDQVTQMALGNGLRGCVMFGVTGVRLMQLKRLLLASGDHERFAYAETQAEGEQQLATFMSAR
jgi:hypothetical protein